MLFLVLRHHKHQTFCWMTQQNSNQNYPEWQGESSNRITSSQKDLTDERGFLRNEKGGIRLMTLSDIPPQETCTDQEGRIPVIRGRRRC